MNCTSRHHECISFFLYLIFSCLDYNTPLAWWLRFYDASHKDSSSPPHPLKAVAATRKMNLYTSFFLYESLLYSPNHIITILATILLFRGVVYSVMMRVKRILVRTPVSNTTKNHYNFVVVQPLVIER